MQTNNIKQNKYLLKPSFNLNKIIDELNKEKAEENKLTKYEKNDYMEVFYEKPKHEWK